MKKTGPCPGIFYPTPGEIKAICKTLDERRDQMARDDKEEVRRQGSPRTLNEEEIQGIIDLCLT